MGLSGRYIHATPPAAKGDLAVAWTESEYSILSIGADRQVLTVDSTQPLGVKWAAAAVSGMDQVYPLAGTGLLAASLSPTDALATSTTANNQAFFARTWIPANITITSLWLAVRDAGTWDGSTAGSTIGVYTDAGVFIDKIGTADNLWTGTGWVGGALSAGPITAQTAGRFVYLAALYRGLSVAAGVQVLASANDGAGNLIWYNSGPAGSGVTNRRTFYQTALSALPGSFTPASAGTASTFTPLLAVT